MYSREVRTLVELELERNAKVREMVGAYEELAEVEKALFRLAVEISEDNTDRSVERRRPYEQQTKFRDWTRACTTVCTKPDENAIGGLSYTS